MLSSRARKSIVWLASYPKSGNTWLRVFLANYLFNRQTPMPINEVYRIGMGDAVEKAYRLVAEGPFNVADPRQAVELRPRVLARVVANGAEVNFLKTHNRRGKVYGIELIPPHMTRSAIYIVRSSRLVSDASGQRTAMDHDGAGSMMAEMPEYLA